jgi:hypothetical protein
MGVPMLDEALDRLDAALVEDQRRADERKRAMDEAFDKLDAVIVATMRACGIEPK